MTSVLKRVAQQGPRTQYFYTSAPVDGIILVPESGVTITPVMEKTQISNGFTYNILPGPLLKDLGRQITVYDNTTPGVVGSPHIAIFRQVMDVNGAFTEGVISPQPIPPIPQTIAYICTWVSSTALDPPFILAEVARTG